METPIEPLKLSFPDLVLDIEAMAKNNKNILVEWFKGQLQKLNSVQCAELLSKCTALLPKPQDGKERVSVLDTKWKFVVNVHQGKFVFKPTTEVKEDTEFKLMLLVVTALREEMLSQFMKDIVDFLPKAKAPIVEAVQ
jgi:hypothetical protein